MQVVVKRAREPSPYLLIPHLVSQLLIKLLVRDDLLASANLISVERSALLGDRERIALIVDCSVAGGGTQHGVLLRRLSLLLILFCLLWLFLHGALSV